MKNLFNLALLQFIVFILRQKFQVLMGSFKKLSRYISFYKHKTLLHNQMQLPMHFIVLIFPFLGLYFEHQTINKLQHLDLN